MVTLKSLSVKRVLQVVIRDARGTWHELNLVTSIQCIHKKQPDNLASGSGWQNREIQVISKNAKEGEDVQIKKLIAAPCEET